MVMKRFFVFFLILMFCFLPLNGIMGQGMVRSRGIGIRGGFWKSRGGNLGIHVSSENMFNTNVHVNGVAGCLYFFSRLYDNWFMEVLLASNVNVDVESSGLFNDNVNANLLLPVLIGIRYDVLPTRVSTNFQPYVAGGAGPYIHMHSQVRDEFMQNTDISVTSDIDIGCFLGTGLNVILRDWLAWNMDLKYHLLDADMNHPYSGFAAQTGLSLMWGRKREIFRVNEIRVIVKDIYPAYYQFYSMVPLALVTVQNTVSYPIEVNVKSSMKHYCEGVHESGFVEIPWGQTRDIPVHLVFGPQLLESSYSEPAVMELEIEARAGITATKTMNAQVTVHPRNAWDGAIDKLGFFITPEAANVMSLARKQAGVLSDSIVTILEKFELGRQLFDEMHRMGIRYQRDPNIPFYQDDRVQYAETTMRLGSGDCDDLVVLYASLLESQGIRTAFVDVRDPQKSQAHVYLMFDSGVPAAQSGLISSNEKRYVVRDLDRNGPTVWIPVEATLIPEGFEEAWQNGAIQYLQEGILRHGIAEGWVRIVDVQQY